MDDDELEFLQNDIAKWIDKAAAPEAQFLRHILRMAILETDNLRKQQPVVKPSDPVTYRNARR